ncbi:hypothetical protein CDL12_02341 [Handroanthus impetiginosus]|uniref:Uncharacterized protein n=1 Tax=Handroanthus impetiginosus TaxID=429701 RepID=A0A2G9I571_9LAMI|nr:hypothetical protein CDL12_02341 [Handroanthus impetiginosus]
MATGQNAMGVQAKATSTAIAQQKRDERDFNYTKVPVTIGPSPDPGTKSMQALKKIPPKSEWGRSQQVMVPVDKRWPGGGSNPSVSHSSALPLQASPLPSKTEARYMAIGNELKNLQLGSVREPVIVMQRPQTIAKQSPSSSVSSSPPGTAMGWYPNSVDTVKPNGLVPHVAVSRSLSPNGVSSNNLYNQQLHYQSQQQFVPNNSTMDAQGTTRGNGLWSRGGASPTLSAASSLGLFSGLGGSGSSGSSSPVDWNTGSCMLQFDYSNIDWSLDLGSFTRSNGLCTGANYSMQSSGRPYDSFGYGLDVKSVMRPVLSTGNGGSIQGLQEGVTSSEPTGGGSRDWTSPFEEKDLFSLPRQFVSSPSL